MLESAVITSLKILFVHASMKEGMILFPLRRLFDRFLDLLPVKVQLCLSKPLYSCLFCMASVWGVIFTFQAAWVLRFSWDYIKFLFVVAGINYIIQSLLITEEKL